MSIGLDVLVGVLLVRGYGSAATLALVRLGAGMFFAIVAAVGDDWDPILLSLPQIAGLVLLLVGNPGRPRFVAGCLLVAIYFIASVGTMTLVATGQI